MCFCSISMSMGCTGNNSSTKQYIVNKFVLTIILYLYFLDRGILFKYLSWWQSDAIFVARQKLLCLLYEDTQKKINNIVVGKF